MRTSDSGLLKDTVRVCFGFRLQIPGFVLLSSDLRRIWLLSVVSETREGPSRWVARETARFQWSQRSGRATTMDRRRCPLVSATPSVGVFSLGEHVVKSTMVVVLAIRQHVVVPAVVVDVNPF